MVSIDKLSRTPIYEQIADGFCREVAGGLMREGDQLPSVRELSQLLSANPNTVQKAYLELDRRGVIASSPGVGCFIRAGALNAIRQSMTARLAELHSLVRELAISGIPEEEVRRVIADAYRTNASDAKPEEELQ